jgi:hypothetical protein
MAQAAAEATLAPAELHALRLQLVVDAGAALGALLVTTVLGVYKPRGTTPYGTRKRTDTAPAGGREIQRHVSKTVRRARTSLKRGRCSGAAVPGSSSVTVACPTTP